MASGRKKEQQLHTSITFSQVDFWLLLAVVLLLGIGTMMIFSASTASSYVKTSSSTAYDVLKQQIIYAVSGVALMFVISFIDYKWISRFSLWMFLFSLGLLVLVFSPLGKAYNGARRWLKVGIMFQPSEVLKLTVVFFLAWVFSNPKIREKAIKPWGILIYVLPIGGSIILLAMQPHISCVAIILAITVAMMLAARVRFSTFAWCAVLVAVVVVGVLLFAKSSDTLSFDYIKDRILAHSGSSEADDADTYQATQSLYAIGSGGLLGRGFGKSVQKYLYLPEPYNDFIFSILAEELGFVGVVLVIALFTILLLRGYKISRSAPDLNGSLIAYGITTNVGIQVVLNLAVVSGLMPVTGISLPFFSYGGTSLWIMMVSMGILLNISKQSRYSKF